MSGKATILIVEDQMGFRRIYEDILTSEGFNVLTAEDGEKGLELAREKKPDLVLLDLGLPKLDGFEVLQRLRADEKTKSLPVIIFSVMGEEKEIQKAMNLGANDYVVKGFYTPRQTLSKIKGLMNQEGPRLSSSSYKLDIHESNKDAAKLQHEVGLSGYQCPKCKSKMILELFPDQVHQEGHWFTARFTCEQCDKVF